MVKLRKLYFFFVIWFLVCQFFSFSQDLVAEFEGRILEFKIIENGDINYIVNNSATEFVQIDYKNGEITPWDLSFFQNQIFDIQIYKGNVVFITRSRNRIVQCDANGNILRNLTISGYRNIRNIKIVDDVIYFTASDNSNNIVISQINSSFSDATPIFTISSLSDYTIVDNILYTSNLSGIIKKSLLNPLDEKHFVLPADIINPSKIFGVSNDKMYFISSTKSSTSYGSLKMLNLVNGEYFHLVDEIRYSMEMEFDDQFFYLYKTFDIPSSAFSIVPFVKGNIENNDVTFLIQGKNKDEYYLHLKDKYFYIHKEKTGLELATFENGELKMIELNTGPGGSISSNRKNIVKYNNEYYAVLTNGNDQYQYLYKILDNGNYQCIKRFPGSTNYFGLHIYNDHLYYIDYNPKDFTRNYQLFSISLFPNEIQPEQESVDDGWYRQIYFYNSLIDFSPSFLPEKTKISSNKDVFILCQKGFDSDNKIYDNKSFDSHLMNGKYFLIKYDSNGNRKWVSNIGNTDSNCKLDFETDNENNLIILVRVTLDYAINNEIFLNRNMSNRFKTFILKLDGKTGEMMWKKEIYQSVLHDRLTINKFLVTPSNDITIIGQYTVSDLKIQNKVVSSDSKENFIMSFDKNGDIKWLKNFNTSIRDRELSNYVFVQDYHSKNYLVAQSKDWFNNWNKCQQSSSNVLIHQFDSIGNFVHSHSLESNDRLSVTAGLFNNKGDFLGFGFVRGTFNSPNFQFETQFKNECNIYNGFIFKIDKISNSLTELRASLERRIDIFDSKFHNDSLYLLVRIYDAPNNENGKEYRILKFNKFGDYIGSKIICQDTKKERNNSVSFDVKDGIIAITISEPENYAPSKIFNTIFTPEKAPYVGLIVTTDSDWDTETKFFTEIQPDLSDTKGEFKIYPNPTFDRITIVLPENEEPYQRYEIFDLKGSLIYQGSLNSNLIQNIDLSYLQQGLYFIRCISDSKYLTAKVIKM